MANGRRGFTLIELVIVIAIIGILASLSVPKFVSLRTQARQSKAKAGLGAVRAALATRYAASATGGAVASYPTTLLASDFANAEVPRNPLSNNGSAVGLIAAYNATNMGGDACLAQHSWDYWYVSNPASADYGKAGTVSDGQTNTCGW
jgi:prepilin-type N-terminal cleavage/methylation domain-containing protein